MGPQLAFLVVDGILIGAALSVLIAELLPRQAHLGQALANLDAANLLAVQPPATPGAPTSWARRAGSWVDRHLGHLHGFRAPSTDLDLLGISREQFYTDKTLAALAGFLAPALLTGVVALFDVGVPVALPGLLCLLMAWVAWRHPDAKVRLQAWQARRDFTAAAVAFLRLTSVMRRSGRGVKTSMELASRLSGQWMFQRISQALYLAHYRQQPPWQALAALGARLRLVELEQIAITCKIGGEGGNVSDALASGAGDMRRALLDEQRQDATDTAVALKKRIPLLVVVMIALVMVPVIVQLFAPLAR